MESETGQGEHGDRTTPASERELPAPFQSFEPGERAGAASSGIAGSSRLRDISLPMLLPNLITILAICAGLTSVRMAFEGRVGLAVALILAAAFLDAIDGRVARLLKASSRFGEQMDSLADVVNFGVVPALVLYAFLLDRAGSIGWIAALVYAVAMTLRLARFNVMLEEKDQPAWKKDFFVGVPAPGGAMLVLLPVYLGLWGLELDRPLAFAAAAYTVCVALLLVSALPVYSGKSSGTRVPRRWAIPLLLLVVVYVAVLLSYEWFTLSLTALAYLAFLPLSARLYWRRAEREGRS